MINTSTTSSRRHFARRRLALVVATAVVAASLPVAGAFGQASVRQVVDTGMRNTRPGHPMSIPRSAGGMAGMSGMAGAHAGADSSAQAMIKLYMRMMSDPVILQRVMSDSVMRRLADQASASMSGERVGHMAMPMSDGSHAGMAGMSGMSNQSKRASAGMDQSRMPDMKMPATPQP
jgi:hypothetical protein